MEAMEALSAFGIIVTITLALQARISLRTPIVAQILKNRGRDIGAIIASLLVATSAGIAPWNQCSGRAPLEAIQALSALLVAVTITLALPARMICCTTMVSAPIEARGGDIGAIIGRSVVTTSAGRATRNQFAGRIPLEAIQALGALLVTVTITLTLHARIICCTTTASQVL